MDAVKFVETLQRKIKNENREEIIIRVTDDANLLVDLVEELLNNHSIKTRQSVLLEQYPDAIISNDGLPDVAPCQLCAGLIRGESVEDCENRGLCAECRKDFWLERSR